MLEFNQRAPRRGKEEDMKVVFTVPEGEFCLDCPHQERFRVDEIEATCMGDPHPRYLRVIDANCHLFNEPIQGVALSQMVKCRSCRMKAE